jgi:hypothetical protein
MCFHYLCTSINHRYSAIYGASNQVQDSEDKIIGVQATKFQQFTKTKFRSLQQAFVVASLFFPAILELTAKKARSVLLVHLTLQQICQHEHGNAP